MTRPPAEAEFPRRVFVLCTGRCGSTTFARACSHLTNWTAGHETRSHLVGAARLAYPEGHIEADNRLAWLLGRLDAAFGDRAAYVHLTRDPEEVARSYARRVQHGIIRAYRNDILMGHAARDRARDPIESCRDLVATVTANIEMFLRSKTHVLAVRLETVRDDFDTFLGWVDGTGDLAAARAELLVRHNASEAA